MVAFHGYFILLNNFQFCLDSAGFCSLNQQQIGQIQSSQTGGELYRDISTYEMPKPYHLLGKVSLCWISYHQTPYL